MANGVSESGKKSRLAGQLISFSKFILVLSGVWTFGLYGLSVAWVCVAGVFVYIWMFEGKFSLMHPLSSLQSLRDTGDVDQTVWLTKIFDKLWPYSKARVEQFLRTQLQTSIRSNLPSTLQSFTFTTIDLGEQVPEVLAVHIKESDGSYIILDMEILYNSDADIGVSISRFESSIRDVQVHGTFRLVLTDLHHSWPFFGKMNLSFVSAPSLNFRLAKAASVFDIVGFREIIHEKILDQLTNILVLPHYLTVPVAGNVDSSSTVYPLPQGVLRIQVNRAKDLMQASTDAGDRGITETYCTVQVGGTRYRTGTIQNTDQPIWNETFEFLVHDASNQLIEIQCVDDSSETGSGSVGCCSLSLSEFTQHANKSLWLPLDKMSQASISLTTTWLQLTTDMSLLQSSELSGSTWLSTAVVGVTVESASKLPKSLRGLSKPSSYVRVILEGKSCRSRTSQSSNNPTWGENFYFFSVNPDRSDIQFEVMDSLTDSLLGRASVPLHRLIDAPEVTSHTIKLEDSAAEATLKVGLVLRALSPVKQSGAGSDVSGIVTPRTPVTPILSESTAVTRQMSLPLMSSPLSVARQLSKPTTPRQNDSSDNDNSDIFDMDTWSDTDSNAITGGSTFMVISRPDGSRYSEIVQNANESEPTVVDVDESKYGQIQATIRYSAPQHKLMVCVHQCRNLEALSKTKDKAPDPFVMMTLYNKKSKLERKKTRSQRSTFSPVFDETFDFKLPKSSADTAYLELRVMRNKKRLLPKGKSSIGHVVIGLNALDLSEPRTNWFLMKNVKGSDESVNDISMVSHS